MISHVVVPVCQMVCLFMFPCTLMFSMRSCFSAFLSPCYTTNLRSPAATLLVAVYRGGYLWVFQRMFYMQPEQDPSSSSSWPSVPLTCPLLTLVPYFLGLYQWSSLLQWSHHHPHFGSSVLQDGKLYTPSQTS